MLPNKLAVRPLVDGPPLRAYLAGQGYAPAELQGLLHGTTGAPRSVGLLEAVELRVAALEQLAGGLGDVPQLRRVAIAGYLSAHPPGRVATATDAPPATLTPEQLGARLVRLAGRRYRDPVTGSTWAQVGEAGDGAPYAVAAATLLAAVGVEVPAVLLAVRDGEAYAVHRDLVGWDPVADPLRPATAARWAQDTAADAWVGWTLGLSGVRERRIAMPSGFAVTVRVAFDGALGRAGTTPTWGPELSAQVRTHRPTEVQLRAGARRLEALRSARVLEVLEAARVPDAQAVAAVLDERRRAILGAILTDAPQRRTIDA